MAQSNLQSAGVSTREIDLTGPRLVQPVGIPAGVIGTSVKGPAFVPVTLAVFEDFTAKFGAKDGEKYAPYAVDEWLRNAQAVTFFKVLGIGDGKQRTSTGNNPGSVTNAGFVVGQELPNTTAGAFAANPYANSGGPLGRLYFLGCYMSDSVGSSYLRDAGVTPSGNIAHPIIRGVMMAPSGVILRLSSSNGGVNTAPASTLVADNTTTSGSITGSLVILDGSTAKQEFVLFMNGHKNTAEAPNVITASFDIDAQNHFAKAFNTDPTKIEELGHLLYASYDIHSAMATPLGNGILSGTAELAGTLSGSNQQEIVFLTTGSTLRNQGSTTVPSFENFEDRFRSARTPFMTSQTFGGGVYDLFRLEAIDDGEWPNTNIKISVENVTPSTDVKNKYGTFDIVVRDFSDNDPTKRVIEAYRGCTLDRSSDSYLGKLIGDQKLFFDLDKKIQSQKLVLEGSYENRSNLVRVIFSDKHLNNEVPPEALPLGFRGPDHLVTSGSAPLTTINGAGNLETQFVGNILKRAVEPPLPLRENLLRSTTQINSDLYWGVQFELANNAALPNGTTRRNPSIAAMTKYMPRFATTNANVSTGSNAGVADTAANGILDSDRFNRNAFSLENIQVVTASGNVADVNNAASWTYVRAGEIAANAANKTRAFDVTKDLATAELRALFKYSVLFQGGFNGVNIYDSDMAKQTNKAVSEEMNNTNRGITAGPTVAAYRKAITVMQNTSDVEIKLLTIPGLRHSSISDFALEAVKDRFDALYIMDIEEYDTLNTLVTSSIQTVSVKNTVTNTTARALDNNFGAAYFPDVTIEDDTYGAVRVPPSVVVLGAYALNDRIGQEWFAPAGNTRGALPSVLDTTVNLNRKNQDNLYEADINPLVGRPDSNGVVVFGQKTLQAAQSALDRVNVRRLLIYIRRQVREIANGILFEPNRAVTLAKFSNAVEPRLAAIQNQRGLERFRVMIDSSTTTQEDIENNTIRGKVFVQPTRTAEFISLDFVVTNAGAEV